MFLHKKTQSKSGFQTLFVRKTKITRENFEILFSGSSWPFFVAANLACLDVVFAVEFLEKPTENDFRV